LLSLAWITGYWLGNGTLNCTNQAIQFCPTKEKDWRYLDELLPRTGLPQLVEGGRGRLGYWRQPEPSESSEGLQRRYLIYAPTWWTYFGEQYGHKYKGGAEVVEMLDSPEPPTQLSPEPEEGEDEVSPKPWWWWVLKLLSAAQLRTLLRGLRYADGNQAMVDVRRAEIYTSSARVRDHIQRAALLAGYSCVFYVHVAKGQQTGVNKRGVPVIASTTKWGVAYGEGECSLGPVLSTHRDVRCVEPGAPDEYVGRVWCVTVPHADHLVMVRKVLKIEDGVVTNASRPIIIGNCITVSSLDDGRNALLGAHVF
jgi:hypothetical protein